MTERSRPARPAALPVADGEPAPRADPVTLRWGVRIVLVQAAALATLSGLLVYADLTAEVTTVRMALSVTGYALMMTSFFVILGVALARRRRWARGPAIVLELLQVPVGISLIKAGLPQIGAPILALALGGAALLLAPATRLALGNPAGAGTDNRAT